MLIAVTLLRRPKGETSEEAEALAMAKAMGKAAKDKGEKLPPMEAIEDVDGSFIVTSGGTMLDVARAWGVQRVFVTVTGNAAALARARLDLESGAGAGDDAGDNELAAVMIHFRDVRTGVEVKDRKYRFKKYRQCFVGSEAVDFLVDNGYVASRFEAVELGEKMRAAGLFSHVVDDHGFKDDKLFYAFDPDFVIQTTSYSILDTQSAAAASAAKLSLAKYDSLVGTAEWDELAEAATQQLLDIGVELRRLELAGESAPQERLAVTSTLDKVKAVVSKLEGAVSGKGIKDAEARRRTAALARLTSRLFEAKRQFSELRQAHRPPETSSSYDWSAGSSSGVLQAHEYDETETEELLMLQRQIIAAQDAGLEELSKTLERQIKIGRLIGEELDRQNELLDTLVTHVDATQDRLTDAQIDMDNLL